MPKGRGHRERNCAVSFSAKNNIVGGSEPKKPDTVARATAVPAAYASSLTTLTT